jgi:hypothetical protein
MILILLTKLRIYLSFPISHIAENMKGLLRLKARPHLCLQGLIGFPGVRGPKGDQGSRGAQGEKGDKGALGLEGEKGDVGEKGVRGPPGPDGSPGLEGPEGPKVSHL